MTCTGTARIGELEFIRSLATRQAGECRGPIVEVIFRVDQFSDLEDTLASEAATDLLFSGFRPFASHGGLTYQLCAGHWLDILTSAMDRAFKMRRLDRVGDVAQFARLICDGCSWDLREISNLLRWQRTPNA